MFNSPVLSCVGTPDRLEYCLHPCRLIAQTLPVPRLRLRLLSGRPRGLRTDHTPEVALNGALARPPAPRVHRQRAPSLLRNPHPLLIRTSLASGEKHGYALLGDIESFAGVRLGPGTLYGAISRLEDRGLIEAAGEAGRRRPYRLTAGGVAALESALGEMRTIVDEGTARLSRNRRPGVALGGLA